MSAQLHHFHARYLDNRAYDIYMTNRESRVREGGAHVARSESVPMGDRAGNSAALVLRANE
jgi:hypothetical protein